MNLERQAVSLKMNGISRWDAEGTPGGVVEFLLGKSKRNFIGN